DRTRDLALLISEPVLQPAEPRVRIRHRETGARRDILAAHLHAQRLGLQALAAASLAWLRRLELGEFLAHPGAVGLQHPAVEITDHTFERLVDRVALLAVLERERNRQTAGAVQDDGPL